MTGGLTETDWRRELFERFEQGPSDEDAAKREALPPPPRLEADDELIVRELEALEGRRNRYRAWFLRRFRDATATTFEDCWAGMLADVWRAAIDSRLDLSEPKRKYVQHVLRNQFLGIMRGYHRRRRRERVAGETWWTEREAAELNRRVAERRASAARLEAEARVAWLAKRLRDLDETDRQLVAALAATGDGAIDRIAAAIGWPPGRTRTRVQKLRRELRQGLYDAGLPVPGALKPRRIDGRVRTPRVSRSGQLAA